MDNKGKQLEAGESQQEQISSLFPVKHRREGEGRGKGAGSRATQFRSLPDGIETTLSRVTTEIAALKWFKGLAAKERGAVVLAAYQQQGKAQQPSVSRATSESEQQGATSVKRKVTRRSAAEKEALIADWREGRKVGRYVTKKQFGDAHGLSASTVSDLLKGLDE